MELFGNSSNISFCIEMTRSRAIVENVLLFDTKKKAFDPKNMF